MSNLPDWVFAMTDFDERRWFMPVVCLGRQGSPHAPELLAIIYSRGDGLYEGGPGMSRSRMTPGQGPSAQGSFNFSCLRSDCEFNRRIPRNEWKDVVRNAAESNPAFITVSLRD